MFGNKLAGVRTLLKPRLRFGAKALVLLASVAAAWGQSGAEDLRITLGKSVVIDYPTDVARISTSNPEIVDAVAVSTREILLHAKGNGVSTIVIWAKSGQRTFYNVSVEHNLEPIRRILKETFPDDAIQIQAARDSVSLVGRVSSQAVSDRAAALVASLSKTVVNNLQIIPGPVEKQIMIRVKFAELDRTTSKQFGINLLSTGFANTPGVISTGQFAAPKPATLQGAIPGGLAGTTSNFSITDALNIFAFRPDLNLAATIKALQSQGVLQILSEPNLVTSNGKEATFLVGGEFPVPILQGGANSGAVTVQFREFGIRLTFNPILTFNKTLKMYIKPEVSQIDIANSVTLNGFQIPALSTRRMETNIELAPGQSFVIGGLVDDHVTESMNKIPGLANIPLLGQIFKSRSEAKQKTELIVMVTPEIVDPLNPADPKPLPAMPREFLGPVVMPAASGASKPAKTTAKKSASRRNKHEEQTPEAVETAEKSEPAASFDATAKAADAAKPEPSAAAQTNAAEANAAPAPSAAAAEAQNAPASSAPEAAAPAPASVPAAPASAKPDSSK